MLNRIREIIGWCLVALGVWIMLRRTFAHEMRQED